MVNLAGYDLIIQIAREAIRREVLNTPLAFGPGGEVLDTLVPPFAFEESLPHTGIGGRFHLIVRKLDALAAPRTANLVIELEFSDGSIMLPHSTVRMMAGSYRLVVPLLFTQPTFLNRHSELAVNFPAAKGTMQLNPDSQSSLEAQLGSTGASLAVAGMRAAILGYFHSQGVRTVGLRFRIIPYFDSDTMMTLTAVPQILWIDRETLAIFGRHRRAAPAGNPFSKTQSDLPPPPFSNFPGWSPVVAMLSPESFHRMIACPAVAAAARDHVAGAERKRLIAEEGARINNQGEPTEEQLAAAEQRLSLYLNSTEGMARIQSKTPQPCGQGAIDQRIPMPDPFAATTAYITHLSMTLGNGRIDITARAHAEVFCGRVDVTLPMWIEPRVNQPLQQVDAGPVFRGRPRTNVDVDLICEVIVGTLLSFLVGPFVGSIVTIVGVAIGEGVAESLLRSKLVKQDMPTPDAGGALPPFVRWERVEINPSALVLIGDWPGQIRDPRSFEPRISIVTGSTSRPSSSTPTEAGRFTVDCPQGSGTFTFRRHAWDTTIRLSISGQDVPQPLTFGNWTVVLNGRSFVLQPGEFTMSGNVIVLEPPSRQKLEPRPEIVLGVDGSNDSGWVLAFRGEDAVQSLEVSTVVTDGSGRRWYPRTGRMYVHGQTLDLPADYHRFAGNCREAYIEIGSRYELVRDVPHWEQVLNFDRVVYSRIREAVSGRPLGAALQLQALLTDFPALAERIVPELPNDNPQYREDTPNS